MVLSNAECVLVVVVVVRGTMCRYDFSKKLRSGVKTRVGDERVTMVRM